MEGLESKETERWRQLTGLEGGVGNRCSSVGRRPKASTQGTLPLLQWVEHGGCGGYGAPWSMNDIRPVGIKEWGPEHMDRLV